MYYTVTINGIAYSNEVCMQVAMDYLLFRARRAKKAGGGFSAMIVSAETGEIVYECADNPYTRK